MQQQEISVLIPGSTALPRKRAAEGRDKVISVTPSITHTRSRARARTHSAVSDTNQPVCLQAQQLGAQLSSPPSCRQTRVVGLTQRSTC